MSDFKVKQIFIFSLIFSYFFFLVYLFPIHFPHEFQYAEPGNPWILQWKEFLKWHGRFLTHIPMRYTLQLGYPYFYIFKTIIIFSLFFVGLRVIEPKIYQCNRLKYFFLFSLFMLINCLFPFVSFMMYFGYDLAPLYTYYITAIFMILLLQYYLNIFKNKTNINIPVFCFIAFLTGASHEQAIALIPLIILIYFLLKIKSIPIPRWYWLSVPFFLLGFSIIMFTPGTNNRIILYAKAETWKFMGQTVNWLELGWQRYFYSLFRHIFITSDNWYSYPGFLPSTWHLQLLIFIFTFFNVKKYQSWLDNRVLFPLLFWVLSWFTCLVMAVSPMYHSTPVEFGKFFMYIALAGAIYYYFENTNSKMLLNLSFIFTFIVLTGQLIQVQPLLKAKREYFEIIEKIENNEVTNITLPQAKLGNILITEFGAGLPVKYPHISIISH